MQILRQPFNFIKSFFKAVLTKSPKAKTSRPEYIIKYLEDVPENSLVEEKVVYLIGEAGYHWVAAFKCPCGCGDLIQLNLLTNSSPSWRIIIDKNGLSIFPSIDRIVRCKSHFVLKEGKVNWWGLDSI